jgi:hypothetical protein
MLNLIPSHCGTRNQLEELIKLPSESGWLLKVKM